MANSIEISDRHLSPIVLKALSLPDILLRILIYIPAAELSPAARPDVSAMVHDFEPSPWPVANRESHPLTLYSYEEYRLVRVRLNASAGISATSLGKRNSNSAALKQDNRLPSASSAASVEKCLGCRTSPE